MKRLSLIFIILLAVASCKLSNKNQTGEDNKELSALFDRYYEERMRLFPLESTANGENRYNDLLPVDFTDSYRDTLRTFFTTYLTYVNKYDRESLNDNDRISYDIFKREMQMNIE